MSTGQREKSHRRILGVAAVFALVAAGWSGAAWAQGQAAPMRPGARLMRPLAMGTLMMPGRIARQLGLTDQQRQDIRAVVQSHRDQMKPLVEQSRQLQRQLREAIEANDTAAIDSLAVPLGQAQANLAKLRAQVRAEVFAKLTPDQQARAKQLEERFQQQRDRMQQRLQQMRERMQQRMQPRTNQGRTAR